MKMNIHVEMSSSHTFIEGITYTIERNEVAIDIIISFIIEKHSMTTNIALLNDEDDLRDMLKQLDDNNTKTYYAADHCIEIISGDDIIYYTEESPSPIRKCKIVLSKDLLRDIIQQCLIRG